MVPLDGLHKNAAALTFLIYSEFPHGIEGVQLTSRPVPQVDAEVENGMLDRWAAAAGVPASLHGNSRIDFRQASFEEFLVSGFSWWEGLFRWTTGEATLRLERADGDLVIRAYAPVGGLRQRFPALREIHVRVGVDAAASGEFSIATSNIEEYRIAAPGQPSRRRGPVVITLQPDFIWHARDLDTRSLDDRDLSFALLSIGFAKKQAAHDHNYDR